MQKLIVLLALLFFPALAYAQGFGSPNGVGFPSNGSGSGGGLTSPVGISDGGTGQTTKAAGFNALSPLTTQGDILYGGASGAGTRLAKGTALQILRTNAGATAPEWATPAWQIGDGGTGLSSFTGGDTLYYASGTLLSKLAKGTAGQLYMMNAGATAPEWDTMSGDVTIAAGGATTIKSSVALAGNPTTTTQSANDNSTKIATTAYADRKMTNPMTTTGDIIQSSDNSGTPARLARGTIGQRLEMGPSSLLLYSNQPAASPTVRTPKLRKFGSTYFNGTTYKNYGWTGSTTTTGSSVDDTDANGGRLRHITGTTANNATYTSWTESYKPVQGFRLWFRTGMSTSTLADKSVYYGVTSNFATLVGSDSANSINYICVRRQGATDTNYQLAYCNASTLTTVDTGIAAALSDDHTWCLDITGTVYNVYCDGVLCATSGSNLPTSTNTLFPVVGVATRTTAAANCHIWCASYEGE